MGIPTGHMVDSLAQDFVHPYSYQSHDYIDLIYSIPKPESYWMELSSLCGKNKHKVTTYTIVTTVSMDWFKGFL